MTISDQITRLNNAKAAIKQSIENKGVEVSDTALLDEYPALIDSIEAGGGEGGDPTDSVYYDVYMARTKNETSYYELFKESTATTLDVSNWDTSNVTSMQYTFQGCNSLTSIEGLSNWDTSNVTTMNGMLRNCESLISLDLSNWDTSSVTNMNSMFFYCNSLTSLDLSNFDTSSVTNMQNMIYYCANLEEVDLRNFDMTNVTNMNNILGLNSKLHTIRLDNCSNDTINKIITSSMFPTNAITGVTRKIFVKEENAAGLTAPTNWVFEYVEEPIPLYVSGQFSNKGDITEVRTMVNNTHTSLRNMFDCCFNLASIIGIEDWDTSNVTTMGLMFNYCHKLTTLDLSAWNTSKVTEMYCMFSNCSNLTSLDLSNFDMTNVTNHMGMFGSCYELHTVRLDNCSNATISKIVTSASLPTGTVNGTTRKIYCKEENVAGLTAPNGWEFIFVE